MKKNLILVVTVCILGMVLGACSKEGIVRPAKSMQQYETKMKEQVDNYAAGNGNYQEALEYYNVNKEKYDSAVANQDFKRLEEIKVSKDAFLEGKNQLEKSDEMKAFESYIKVIEEDVENYNQTATVINEIKGNVINNIVQQADALALGYYYEEAIALVETIPAPFDQDVLVLSSKQKYQEMIDGLVPYKGEVSHVFFHSLIYDKSKAFDGDHMENGYNYWMTTIPEFKMMMQSMYDRGFVLVDIHSFAEKIVDENGDEKYVKKEVLLPPGKIPFVLSIDDVNYYEYMKKDGFADRMVLDEDGNVACLVKTDEGDVIARDFDVVPLLDVFVEANPDFSFRGAKGILALTGYQGVLGYRTNELDSPNYEKDKAEVLKVIERLKETGWTFASHGYGHRHTKQISFELLKDDTEKWEREVMSLLGPTDVYIYPYGEEVMPGEEKFQYLQDKGFNIFCGVWSKPFLKIYETSIRMTRRNLDGYAMNFKPEALVDLFDPYEVMDKDRPVFK